MSERLDRIRGALVGLRMPRALEALAHILSRLERGEITAVEAIDALLSEEYTTREGRRIEVVATALLDRLLHHAVVIQIEGASYRLRAHADLIPEHVRANAPIMPPPPPKRRGRRPKLANGAADH